MKHTPGPWGCYYTSNHTHDYRLTKLNGNTLPVNAPCNDHSEQRANEKLIAAAPDLLETLENLILACEYCKPERILTSKAVLLARQAIAKATGE